MALGIATGVFFQKSMRKSVKKCPLALRPLPRELSNFVGGLAPPSRRPSQILSRFRSGKFELRRRGAAKIEPAGARGADLPQHTRAAPQALGPPWQRPTLPRAGGRHRSAHGAAQKRGAGPSAPISRRSRLATRKSQSGGPQPARGRRAPRDQRERDRWTTRRAPRVDGGRSGALWGGGEGRARGGSASGARCSGGSSGLRDACESGIGDLKSGRGAPGHKLPRALRAALEMGDDGVY